MKCPFKLHRPHRYGGLLAATPNLRARLYYTPASWLIGVHWFTTGDPTGNAAIIFLCVPLLRLTFSVKLPARLRYP